MSNHISSEVYKRKVGSASRKQVMGLFADKASDNGTGIWAAKQTMADELELTKQTVITVIKGLLADGLVIEVGHRKCQNGYLVEYAINLKALRALPLVKSHQDDRSNHLTGQTALPVKEFDPTGQTALPDQSNGLTQTSLEPSLNQKPPNPLGRGCERAPIPEIWDFPGIDDLPATIAVLARQWPPGAYQVEAAAFHQHWRGRGTKRPDWAASWAARVQARHEMVMRAGKAGVAFVASAAGVGLPVDRPAAAAKRREDDRSAELHDALRENLGPALWAQWFEPVALIFEDVGLAVVAPSAFHAAQIEANHRDAIEKALSATGRGVEWMRIIAERAAVAKKGAAARG